MSRLFVVFSSSVLFIIGAHILLSTCVRAEKPYFPIENQNLSCSACQEVAEKFMEQMDEMEKKHGRVMIVGSRLSDKGYEKRSYYKSESHVVDALDGLCTKFKDYFSDGRMRFVSTKGLLSLINMTTNADAGKMIGRVCERIVERHEDDFLGLVRAHDEKDSFSRALCIDTARACTQTEYDYLLTSSSESSSDKSKADNETPPPDADDNSTAEVSEIDQVSEEHPDDQNDADESANLTSPSSEEDGNVKEEL